jgi:RimJ/RimL family protein N-acetyltransferase
MVPTQPRVNRFLPGFTPPREVLTQRLALRAWTLDDAPILKATIDRNIEHLTPWIPWAPQHPKSLDELFVDVERFVREFETGVAWIYGMFRRSDNALVGGIGLHPRIGPGGVEIGYWLDRDATGNGYVTEAARALEMLAFSHPSVTHVEIRLNPLNLPSAAVPRRMGFVHAYTLSLMSGHSPSATIGETMVWRRTRRQFETIAGLHTQDLARSSL